MQSSLHTALLLSSEAPYQTDVIKFTLAHPVFDADQVCVVECVCMYCVCVRVCVCVCGRGKRGMSLCSRVHVWVCESGR